jgi:TonB family protein
MRVTLSESQRTRKRTKAGTMASVVFHAAVLGMAVANTGYPTPNRQEHEPETMTRYKPLPPEPTPSGHEGSAVLPAPPGIPAVVDAKLPSFSLDLSQDRGRPADDPAADFRRGLTAGDAPFAGPRLIGDSPYDVSAVEAPARPDPANASPRYPALLASAGIEGSVTVRYVVDTLGHVEIGSIAAIGATHPQFERAVRAVLPGFRFTAAVLEGHRVRQLVEQTFGFELRR